MGRVEQELADMCFRKELQHGEVVIKKSMRVMPRSRPQERKNRKVAFRDRRREHVEVISEIVTVPVGIPTDVTVRLVVDAVAFTVTDPIFQAITGTGFPFPCCGINRGSITGDSKVTQIDQSFINGFIQELGFKDIEEPFHWDKILRRFNFKFRQEFINGHFFVSDE